MGLKTTCPAFASRKPQGPASSIWLILDGTAGIPIVNANPTLNGCCYKKATGSARRDQEYSKLLSAPPLSYIYSMSHSLATRNIGTSSVTAIGWGAMGLSAFYGSVPPENKRLQVCGSLKSVISLLVEPTLFLVSRRSLCNRMHILGYCWPLWW